MSITWVAIDDGLIVHIFAKKPDQRSGLLEKGLVNVLQDDATITSAKHFFYGNGTTKNEIPLLKHL